MKRTILALALLAGLTLGCADGTTVAQTCVDQQGRVVPDDYCQNAQYATTTVIGAFPYASPYGWYYGGSRYYGPNNVLIIRGGNYRPQPSVRYRSGSGYTTYGGQIYRSGTRGTPSYSRPVYSKTQPSYSRPSYSRPTYSRPSYSRPSYSRPSYSRPSYSRPSYSRPSYSSHR